MTPGYDLPQDHGRKVFWPTGARSKPSHGDYPGGFPCRKQRAVLTSLTHLSLGNPTVYCPILRSFISETRNVQFLQPLEGPHVCRTHSRQTVATRLLSPLYSPDHYSLDVFMLPSPDVFFLLLITAVQMMSAAEVWKGSCQLSLSSKLTPKTETKWRKKEERERSFQYHFISTETFKGGTKELVVLVVAP